MTDQELVELLKQGRYDKAMKGLYKAFPVLKKWVVQNSGSKSDAEDVFQEALLVLCKKVKNDTFFLSSSLSTYIIAIGKNIWMAELRKKNIIISDTEDIEVAIIETAEEESSFALAEQAFALLGDKCKEILIMFYHHKKTMAYIASKIGFSTERVAKNQKYRCLEKAKEFYIQLKQA